MKLRWASNWYWPSACPAELHRSVSAVGSYECNEVKYQEKCSFLQLLGKCQGLLTDRKRAYTIIECQFGTLQFLQYISRRLNLEWADIFTVLFVHGEFL